MAEQQLSLLGLDAAQQPASRLFFAILPDAPALARIASLARRLCDERGLHRRPIPADRLHATAHFIGDFADLPPAVLAKARQAAASVASPRFEVCFDRAGSFSGRPGSRPVVLRGGEGVAAFAEFQRSLSMAIHRAGLTQTMTKGAFTPHVTILYDDAHIDEQAVEPVRWDVSEFVLMQSLVGKSRHVLLDRWPLAPA